MNGSASILGDLRFISFACQLIGHNYRRIYDTMDAPVIVIRAGAPFSPSRSFAERKIINASMMSFSVSLDGSSTVGSAG